jgi:hypothetical protein
MGGWTVKGITAYRTGLPFTVFETDDPNEDNVKNDRVNVVAGVPWKGGYAFLTPSITPTWEGQTRISIPAPLAKLPTAANGSLRWR